MCRKTTIGVMCKYFIEPLNTLKRKDKLNISGYGGLCCVNSLYASFIHRYMALYITKDLMKVNQNLTKVNTTFQKIIW